MKVKILLILCFVFTCSMVVKKPIKNTLPYKKIEYVKVDSKRVAKYINRFQKTCLLESKKFNLPKEILMAQGIIESKAGQSGLALTCNNHFGIKCKYKCKPGSKHCKRQTDDHYNDRFMIYPSAWASWRNHSHLLVNNNYKKVCGMSYKEAAYYIKKRGYATKKTYASDLIKCIKKYKLYKMSENTIFI